MKIFSTLEGKGPALVFIHGWTMSHRFFQRQIPLKENFRLLLWDLPGHGLSEKSPQGNTLEDCAAALQQVLEQYEIQSALVVGWSMGGTIFWEYLKQFGADRIAAFFNVESVPWGEEALFQVDATEAAMKKDRPRAARRFIQNMFLQKPSAEELNWMVQESLETPDAVALPLYRAIAHADYRSIAKSFKLPILSIFGRHGFHENQWAEFGQLLSQDRQIFENSGHLPFWEEPEKFNTSLFSWASANGGI